MNIPSVERPDYSFPILDALVADSGRKSVEEAWQAIREYLFQLEDAQLGRGQVRAMRVDVPLYTPRGLEHARLLVEVDADGGIA